jgi:hypothetical protein
MLMRSAFVWDIMQRRMVILTDVSGQGIGPILKGKKSLTLQDDNVSVPSSRVKKSLTLEDGTDTLSRNVGKDYRSALRNIRDIRRSNTQMTS